MIHIVIAIALMLNACNRSNDYEAIDIPQKKTIYINQSPYVGSTLHARVMALLYPHAGGIERLSSEAATEFRRNYSDTMLSVRFSSNQEYSSTQFYILNKIVIIPRDQDSLVFVSVVQDNLYDKSHAEAGMIDLHVLSLRNGRLEIFDSEKDVVTHDWGVATFDADSLLRFGRNTWGWTVSSITSGQGLFFRNQSFFAFINQEIVTLGSYDAEEDNHGALERDYHSITSRFVLTDSTSISISPMTIVWTHTFNGRDRKRFTTQHRFLPGVGYDLTNVYHCDCQN